MFGQNTVSMCIYSIIHIHAVTHIHTHAVTHIHTRTRTHTQTQSCTHTHTQSYAQIVSHTCSHIHITHTATHTVTHIHTRYLHNFYLTALQSPLFMMFFRN